MRCTCCDRLLNDYESTRKSKTTGEYLDMCNKCFGLVEQDIATSIRTDLSENEIPDEELWEINNEWEDQFPEDNDEWQNS